MYLKKQSYHGSCFSCALQMALINLGNLPQTYGTKLEDDFNDKMKKITNDTQNLETNDPNEELVCEIISSLGLPLGNGFLAGPTELSGCEQYYAQRINDALAANENVAFVIGDEHAFAVFWDSQTRKWYCVDPIYDVPNVIDQCNNIYARVLNDGYIVFSEVGSNPIKNIAGGKRFLMMVSQEH